MWVAEGEELVPFGILEEVCLVAGLFDKPVAGVEERRIYFASVVGRCLTSHFLDLPTM